MRSFAIYRLPKQDCCKQVTMIEGTPKIISEISEINESRGFLLAPFSADKTTPIALIEPQLIKNFDLEELKVTHEFEMIDKICEDNNAVNLKEDDPKKEDYSHDFTRFHSRINEGKFRKLVLSRKKIISTAKGISPSKLFASACTNYPHCFVALFSTPFSGTWLLASPELLFEKNGIDCHTVALAGTMTFSEHSPIEWNDKNKREQLYVSNYIKDTISRFSENILSEGPATVKAATLVHLRSDFLFKLSKKYRIGEILKELHPTPAVCGLPKETAKDFIIKNEHSQRSYYSGFCGPICLNDNLTSLYVTLRCMRIRGNEYELFAGGGILKESVEANEWDETEAKMQPMTKILMQ